MKDEIKEILDKFDKVLKNYELDKKWGQMSVDSICHLFPSEMMVIKDYITNLQEELYSTNQVVNELLDVKEENEKLKERCEYLQRSCDRKEEQRDDARMEYMEQEDYKSRNEKAIVYINHEIFKRTILVGVGTKQYTRNILDNVLNILNGGDE